MEPTTTVKNLNPSRGHTAAQRGPWLAPGAALRWTEPLGDLHAGGLLSDSGAIYDHTVGAPDRRG